MKARSTNRLRVRYGNVSRKTQGPDLACAFTVARNMLVQGALNRVAGSAHQRLCRRDVQPTVFQAVVGFEDGGFERLDRVHQGRCMVLLPNKAEPHSTRFRRAAHCVRL